ncbi:hypothetical protein AVEN_166601-1, partial [Araneus ventricosus]
MELFLPFPKLSFDVWVSVSDETRVEREKENTSGFVWLRVRWRDKVTVK